MAASTQAGIVGVATGIGGLAAGLSGKGKENDQTGKDDQSKKENDQTDKGDQNKKENDQTDNDDQGKNENDQTDNDDQGRKNENDEINIGTTAGRKIILGNHSDFEITNNVIKEHKMVKKQVLQDLLELSDEAENMVIEKIDKEMTSTGVAMAGRGIVIGYGAASIFLLSNPIGAGIGT